MGGGHLASARTDANGVDPFTARVDHAFPQTATSGVDWDLGRSPGGFVAVYPCPARDERRQTSFKTQQAAEDIGRQLAAWRKLRGLTAQQVAARADVTRQTVSRIEQGDVAVGMGVFLNVCRSLGILQNVVEATDPYETPFGRARSDQSLPKRVRQ